MTRSTAGAENVGLLTECTPNDCELEDFNSLGSNKSQLKVIYFIFTVPCIVTLW